MNKEELELLRFPVGRHKSPNEFKVSQYAEWINIISEMPDKMEKAISGLTDAQLDTPYRPDGWTLRQVVHHVADSHMNAYIRMKLAVTEENPIIKPYIQDLWANTEDSLKADVQISIKLLKVLHIRWVMFLKSLNESDFDRTFYHPEPKQNQPIKLWVSVYAWHSRHHVGHIESLRKRMNW
jgi:hypothetical protein